MGWDEAKDMGGLMVNGWLGGWYMDVGGFRLPVLPTHYYKEYNIIIMSGIKCQKERDGKAERVSREE